MKKTYIIPETIEIEINTCRIMVAASPTVFGLYDSDDEEAYDYEIMTNGGMK